ncbi:hypothetical protein JHK86_031869 [Glycine max]|nr:hypothetical protein JHK86_031869 [Glycine max]
MSNNTIEFPYKNEVKNLSKYNFLYLLPLIKAEFQIHLQRHFAEMVFGIQQTHLQLNLESLQK